MMTCKIELVPAIAESKEPYILTGDSVELDETELSRVIKDAARNKVPLVVEHFEGNNYIGRIASIPGDQLDLLGIVEKTTVIKNCINNYFNSKKK